MSPCLLLYGLAALVGAVLGGPVGLLASALLVAVVLGRHRLAHRPPHRPVAPARPAGGLSHPPGGLSRAAAGGAR